MAITKESVVTTPTTDCLPTHTGDQSTSKRPKFKPGQYSIDTYFDVSCEDHKDKKVIIRLSGDLKLEYRQNGEASLWYVNWLTRLTYFPCSRCHPPLKCFMTRRED